ncbi:MAG TPA: CoA transferase [Steroidobacteraceae bacterium]|nr:CoA transferase [Steroidobacteraceae bacterium]
MNRGILSGMRVVEASAFVAAPLGGMTLAQLGADVIRIDLPGGGLDFRRWPVTENDVSLFWCGLNKGKRSVCIDFTQPEGRDLAMAIIAAPGEDAGLLLTNFASRGWLSYESLRAKRADLIQLTIQGNRHGDSAVDYTVNPAMGLPWLTGPSDLESPVNHVLPAWDLLTGQMAATGLLAAERHRRRTGDGQHIKLALEDVALATMGNLGFIAEAQLGRTRPRVGNYLYGAFGGDFLCSDGKRVMIVGLTAKQWSALCEALEMHADVADLQRGIGLDLGLEGNRFLAREQIAALVHLRVSRRPFVEIAGLFNRAGVCWSAYQTVAELVAGDPACSEANPLFAVTEQSGVGRILAPTVPLDFSRGGRVPPLPAPRLGEHTHSVLSQIVGLSDAEIQRLHAARIVAGGPSD